MILSDGLVHGNILSDKVGVFDGLRDKYYIFRRPFWKRMVGGKSGLGRVSFRSLPWWTGNPKAEEAVIAGFAAIGTLK